MKTLRGLFLTWIVVMFIVTFTCLLIYLIMQQSLRLGANESPAQLAVETSMKLQEAQNIKNAIPAEKVDISKSLNTFVMVFDNNKNLIATSGVIGGNEPTYPKGIFDTVDRKGEYRVTWQPNLSLRFATVAIKYENGYIVTGRSLKETENLIDSLGRLVLVAWFACAFFLAFALTIVYLFGRRLVKN